ncbi:MAG: hypothetical protein JJU00_13940 [Opitutales bacterium]|nr:hypothetical protein [Opitutales bacterium]
MSLKTIPTRSPALAAVGVFLSAAFSVAAASEPSHRDAFAMNFIGGGEFRQYIMDHHIHEMLYWMEHYNSTLAHSGNEPECCD